MDPTLDDVKKFIEANKDKPEVMEYIKSISVETPLNFDLVNGYLETAEGKTLLQPKLDSYANKAIQSHDEKNKAKIAAEIAKGVRDKLVELNPEDTVEQRRIKEQDQRIKEIEERMENEKKWAKINEIAYKKGIDPAFVSGINFNSVEEFDLYATKLTEQNNKLIDKTKNEVVASMQQIKPKLGQDSENPGDPTKGMNAKQKFEYYKQQAEQRDSKAS
jgi:hypothetical protein